MCAWEVAITTIENRAFWQHEETLAGVEPASSRVAADSTLQETPQILANLHGSPLTLPVACPIDPELLRLAQLWPSLPDPIRSAMMTLVNSVSPAPTSTPSAPPKRDTLDDRLPWEKPSNRQ